MTEEIINADGSRNWQANILLDNIKRLEQENEELKAELNKVIDEREKKIEETLLKGCYQSLGSECRIWELKESKYRSALEEIREVLKPYLTECQGFLCEPIDEVLNKINEVLGEDTES